MGRAHVHGQTELVVAIGAARLSIDHEGGGRDVGSSGFGEGVDPSLAVICCSCLPVTPSETCKVTPDCDPIERNALLSAC